jgi:hypothetical protein
MSSSVSMPTTVLNYPQNMKLSQKVMSLCTPSLIYFVIGMIGLVISFISMIFKKDFSFQSLFVFIINIVSVLFWTWILNILCVSGYKNISWFILVLPYLFLLGIIGWFTYTMKKTNKNVSSLLGLSKKSSKKRK